MSKLLGAHGAADGRRMAATMVVVGIAALAGACSQGGLATSELTTGARPEENSVRTDLAARQETPPKPVEPAGSRSAEVSPPGTSAAALADARRLRQAGDKDRALALLDKAAQKDGKDPLLARERGMLALELGQVDKARGLLKKAVDQGPADWRTHSAYGAALSSAGKQQEAQLQFAKALELAPDQPSVLNNLALSYALDGKHDQAEGLLRRVALVARSDPRARQNLALLLGLKGKPEEALKVSAAVLPADKARANARMLQGKDNAEPAPPEPASGARVPVASNPASGAVRSASVPGSGPTYRLGGPRE